MNNIPIKVVIADDNRFFCEALKDSLQQHQEINVIAFVTTISEVIHFANNNIFDILILDINFNGANSLDYINQIKGENQFKIITLTTLNNNFIKNRALENSVNAFIGKDSDLSKFKDVIIDCYNNDKTETVKTNSKIRIGNLVFTKRKLVVLQALYKYSDKKEKELSTILNITESSLKSHKRELFEITNTNSTPELIKFGIQNGLIVA